MFCPKCSAMITERYFVRENVKSGGGIEMEYDARCPECRAALGRVTWGRLELAPEWRSQDAPPPEPATEPEGESAESPEASGLEELLPEIEPITGHDPKHCPHCGKALPKGF